MKSFTIVLASLALMTLGGRAAFAQDRAVCAQYEREVSSSSGSSVPVVSESLLTDWKTAVGCLVPIVTGLKDSMRAASVGSSTRARYLAATGALRRIATKIAAAEEAAGKAPTDGRPTNGDTIAGYQAEFRKWQSIDTFAVLTVGARSDNYDVRLNSILILGNVMDEEYTCVPLVQLLDGDLDTAEYGVNARANLLGALARAAPFVYAEDFTNIRNVVAAVAKNVKADDPKFKQSSAILENIDQRLNAQTGSSNRSVGLKAKPKSECVKYMNAYPPNERMKALIRY
ncbi:hypothetical protein [Bradyrhizobium sp. CCBAU 53338]|uniref:hypothetical protein n=1 Tax=Bradyrhizobium sp. CCBAU 53338 TaxID=1325111 RepID=UPI00188BCB27|nr:hypothetical protein [Bradyrhizobium sp. CCBAU 53338]QOZ51517.1 hypothetical protein XH90_09095 [Bradyrhizobium sp. CCBAU 53338]